MEVGASKSVSVPKRVLTAPLDKLRMQSDSLWQCFQCVRPFQHRASLVAHVVKNLRAMPETWVRSLGREDSLEKEMATHSSTLAWKIPWKEEPSGLQSMGPKESYTTE